MLQAAATLLFGSIAMIAGGGIVMMLTFNWHAIRLALGVDRPVVPKPLPPRYRAMTKVSRATIMTVRESGLRAAA